jgi:hypothetical protein
MGGGNSERQYEDVQREWLMTFRPMIRATLAGTGIARRSRAARAQSDTVSEAFETICATVLCDSRSDRSPYGQAGLEYTSFNFAFLPRDVLRLIKRQGNTLLCHLTYTQKLIQGWLRPTIDIRDIKEFIARRPDSRQSGPRVGHHLPGWG